MTVATTSATLLIRLSVRHRSVGLLRLTLDITRLRLDFAEVGAVEVVKGAVAPPTPGTDAWWRVAVRETVDALRQRGLV